MSFSPNDTVIVRVDNDGNTLQELLTSDKINFEAGISVSGDLNIYSPSGTNALVNVNGQNIFEVSPSGDVTFPNNVLLEVEDPLYDTSAVNKAYVDSQIESQLVSGTKQMFSYVFTAATNYYTTVNASTLTVVGHMIFRGSNIVGIPTSIDAILGHSSTGVQFQLYDYTNSKIICDVTTTNVGPVLINCGSISNIPTGLSIFQFKLRRTGSNGQGRIYALDIRV
jgi:hypothetical protein